MNFLCPNHRRQFSELPYRERQDLWQTWMEGAYTCGEQGQWRELVSLAGSAFDLACLQHNRDPFPMHIELTLSAILVCHALTDLGDRIAVEKITLRALESLLDVEADTSSGEGHEIRECVSVLVDRSQQAEFFSAYRNRSPLQGRLCTHMPGARTLH